MKSENIDEYVSRMRTLNAQHFVSCSSEWKQNDLEPSAALRKMNEVKVVRYFIKRLPLEIQYRISNNHTNLDDAIREAYLVHDETPRHRNISDHQHQNRNILRNRDEISSSNPSPRQSNDRNITCYNCGMEGHKANACNKQRNQSVGDNAGPSPKPTSFFISRVDEDDNESHSESE